MGSEGTGGGGGNCLKLFGLAPFLSEMRSTFNLLFRMYAFCDALTKVKSKLMLNVVLLALNVGTVIRLLRKTLQAFLTFVSRLDLHEQQAQLAKKYLCYFLS